MRVTMALMRAPLCAAPGVRVVRAPRKAVQRPASFPQLPFAGSRLARLPATRAVRGVVAAAGDDGYSSSDDAEVTSGKRKAVSAMNVAELREELTTAGLDASGSKPELSARVKAARSGKPLPAASEFAAMAAASSKSSDSGDSAKTIARLEEELMLARQMGMAAVTRAEKAEAALAALTGKEAPMSGGSTSPALLRLKVKLGFGDSVLCCGSHGALGAWDVAGAAGLAWSEGDVWQAQVALPQEGRLEMKFVVRTAEGGLVWQTGNNLALEVQKGTPGGDAVPKQRQLAFSGGLSFVNGDRRAPATFTVNGPVTEEAAAAPVAGTPAAAPKKKKADKAVEATAPAAAAPEAAVPAPEVAPPAPEAPAAEAAPAPEAAAESA